MDGQHLAASDVSAIAASGMNARAAGPVAMETRYDCKAFDPAGNLLWEETAYNRVVTVGLNKLLDAAFKTGLTAPAWYVGITSPSITNGIMASTGTTVLSSTLAPWQSVDEGRAIIVRGAGTAGADLVTTISTVTSSSSIGLSTNPATTVAAAAVTWEARSTDTSTAHTPWTESTAFSGAPARPSFTPGTVAAGSVDNSTTVASFSINANNTLIGGCLLANSSINQSSTDILYGMAPFTTVGFRQLNNGDTLQVTVTLTAASA